MKTLADLKRTIKPGIKIKLIDTSLKGHKYLNIERTITEVQTNGFYAATDEQISQGKRGSFCDYPKAPQFECGWNSFRIKFDNDYLDYELFETKAA